MQHERAAELPSQAQEDAISAIGGCGDDPSRPVDGSTDGLVASSVTMDRIILESAVRTLFRLIDATNDERLEGITRLGLGLNNYLRSMDR